MKKIVSLLLALLMTACMTTAVAEEKVYTTLYSGEVNSLNYLTTSTTNEFAVAANLIDTLIEYDRFGRVQPSLAESWETSSDGLVWTFHLRKDATWVDAQGNVVAPLTANDFISSAKYILDAANASGTANLLYGVIAGAKAYYEGTAAPKEGEAAAPKTEWETVGIKALDDYTLEYTLSAPTPYFLSMVDYVCFMPVYGPFLAEKGEGFGLATGNDTLLYCGAYVLSEFKPQERRVLSKNAANWDAGNVLIDRIEYIYNKEASTISPELYLRGEVDSASIKTEIAVEWLNDPAKADLIRPERPTSFYSYFFSFDFDPQFDAAYEPDNWRLAVVNENFRKSIYYALDRVKAKTVADADNAENLLFNAITPTNFVNINGVDYNDMGALKEITALGTGTYQPETALRYRDTAIAELTAAGATFPVKMLMPYNPTTTSWDEECQVIEQQLEELLGADYINVIVEAGPSTGFLGAVRRAGNFAFMKVNFGPDYDDPQTFTDPFMPGNTFTFLDKNEAMSGVCEELYALVEKAKAITDDLTARYLAFAEVEAYIVEHALVVPFGFSTGGYTASRLDPFTMPYTPSGISKERYKGTVLLDAPMSTDQYYDAYDQWLSDRAALAE